MAERLIHQPLPAPWNFGVLADGRIFFINDETRTTTWLHPVTGEPLATGNKPRRDLPRGWEEAVTPEGAPYFVNHNERKTTFSNPNTGKPEIADDYHYLVEKTPKKDQLSTVGSVSSSNTENMEKPNFVNKTVSKKSVPTVRRSNRSTITLSGWLNKQDSSGLKGWKRRWCVLSDFCLFIYKSPDDESILSSVLLPSYQISQVTAEDKIHKKNAFKCVHANMRTYYFYADTEDDMRKWIEKLKLATVLQREGGDDGGDSRTPTENGSLKRFFEDEDDAGFKSHRSPRMYDNAGFRTQPRSASDRYDDHPRYRSPAGDQRITGNEYRQSHFDDRRPRPEDDDDDAGFKSFSSRGSRDTPTNRRPRSAQDHTDSPHTPSHYQTMEPLYDRPGSRTPNPYPSRQSGASQSRDTARPDQLRRVQEWHNPRHSLDSGNSGTTSSSMPHNDVRPHSRSHTLPAHMPSPGLRLERYDTPPHNTTVNVPPSQRHHPSPSGQYPSDRYSTMPTHASQHVQRERHYQQQHQPTSPRAASDRYSTLPPHVSPQVHSHPQQQQQQRQEHRYAARHESDKYHTLPSRPPQQYAPRSPEPLDPQELKRQESLRQLQEWHQREQEKESMRSSNSEALRTSTQSLPIERTPYHLYDSHTPRGVPTPKRPPPPSNYPSEHAHRRKPVEPLVFKFPENNNNLPVGKSPEQRSFLQSPIGVDSEQRSILQSPYPYNIVPGQHPLHNAAALQQSQRSGYYSDTDALPQSQKRHYYDNHPSPRDRQYPVPERDVYPDQPRVIENRNLYTHPEESPSGLSLERSPRSPGMQHSRSLSRTPDTRDAPLYHGSNTRHLTDVMDLETGHSEHPSGPQQKRNEAEALVDKMMQKMERKPQGKQKKWPRKQPELMTMNGHRLRLSISAGDLMGKTHEELVLLLIQLRRNYALTEKNLDAIRRQLELEKDFLAYPDMLPGQSIRKQHSDHFQRSRQELFEHQRKYEELKEQNDDLESRLDVTRPLINLVDNLVKMGNLYGGENAMVVQELYKYQYQLRGDQFTPPKKLIEFSRKLQEDKLALDHEAELKKLETKDDKDLEEKLQRLYELDVKLQDCSTYVNGLRDDMDKIEKALDRVNRHLRQYSDNPKEFHEIDWQRQNLERDLVKVRAQLAEGSKELENITAENAKLEHEIILLRTKIQEEAAQNRNKSPSQDTLKTRMKMERELNRVQIVIDDLARQRDALRSEMDKVREMAADDAKTKELKEKIEKTPVAVRHHAPGPYMVTDLDTMQSADIKDTKSTTTSPQRTDSVPRVQKMKEQVQQSPAVSATPQQNLSTSVPAAVLPEPPAPSSVSTSSSKQKPVQAISPMQQPPRPPPPSYYDLMTTVTSSTPLGSEQRSATLPVSTPQQSTWSAPSRPRAISTGDKSKNTVRVIKRESERRSREKERKKENDDVFRGQSLPTDRRATDPSQKSMTLPARGFSSVPRSPNGKSYSLGGRYFDDWDQDGAYPRFTDQLRTTGRPMSANALLNTSESTTPTQRTAPAGEESYITTSAAASLQTAPPSGEYKTPTGRPMGLRATDGVQPKKRSKSASERLFRTNRPKTLPGGLDYASTQDPSSPVWTTDLDHKKKARDDLAILEIERAMKSLDLPPGSGDVAPDYVIGENKGVEKDEATGFGLWALSVDNNNLAPSPDSGEPLSPSAYLHAKKKYLRDQFFGADPFDKLGLPPKVLIPERYVPETEEDDKVSPEEAAKKEARVEHLKKMLSNHSLQDWHPREFMSDWYKMDPEAEVEGVKEKIEEEKHRREELLTVRAALAKEVKEATKAMAVVKDQDN
ncbi:uncharacterized protein [Ptychodera flava]|uniref:uncharacterized protein isoform X5 n=1 Tax=Ptychodera flava TaxID=63121 RepID=UPI00396A184E